MAARRNHPIHTETGIKQFDAVIVGSGPLGATYARLLVDHGLSVCMIEAGDQESRIPASHRKNEISLQKVMDKFIDIVHSQMQPWSTPSSTTVIPDLGPSAWRAKDPARMTNNNKRNPHQTAYDNIPGASFTKAVGGMSTIWCNATPEFLKGLERPVIFPDSEADDDAEWAGLYDAARALIGVSDKEFDYSIRHQTVLTHLQKLYPDRGIKGLPLAAHRLAPGSPYLQFHAADHVFADMFTNPKAVSGAGVKRGAFHLLTNTLATRFIAETNNGETTVTSAEVQDILSSRFIGGQNPDTYFTISAKTFIVAGGAIGSAQLLAASEFGARRDQDPSQMLIPNLGKYLTEQAMAFCQVVMSQKLMDQATNPEGKPEWWQKSLANHKLRNPTDSHPIPKDDPDTAAYIPVTKEHPWHVQIHRDGLTYGESRVDDRSMVEFVFFGMQSGVESNHVLFENDVTDDWGLPQPTIHYVPTRDYADQSARMIADMTDVAASVGSYMPNAPPTFLITGRGQHIGGLTRAGYDQATTCVDYNNKFWNFKNLFVGGSIVLPTSFAANPTLTAMALAIRGAHKIVQDLATNYNYTDAITPTPREFYEYLLGTSHMVNSQSRTAGPAV